MESVQISPEQEAVLQQLILATSVLFFLFMAWLTWLQVKVWQKNPELISQQKDLRQSVIIMAIAIGMVTLGVYCAELRFEEWPMAVGLALGLACAFVSPVSAFAFFLSLIILRPWEIFHANDLMAALPRASAILVLVVLLMRFIREKTIKFFWSRECSLLVLFIFWTWISGTQSSDPKASLDSFLDMMVRAGVVFFLVVNIIQKKEDGEFIQKVLVGGVLCLLALAIFFNHLSGTDDPGQRLAFVGMMGDPNDISAFGIMALPFALAPFWRSKSNNSGDWILTIIYSLVFLTVLITAQSRGAILSTALFIGMVFMHSAKWSRKSVLIGIITVVVALPFFQLFSSRESGDMAESQTNRMIFWKTAVRMAVKHPIMGIGFDDFPNQFDHYVVDNSGSESGKRTAHSAWLLVLAENGFVGLALFFGLFLTSLLRAVRMRQEKPEFLFAMASYGMAMTFLSHSYLMFPYLLFSLTTASFFIQQKKS